MIAERPITETPTQSPKPQHFNRAIVFGSQLEGKGYGAIYLENYIGRDSTHQVYDTRELRSVVVDRRSRRLTFTNHQGQTGTYDLDRVSTRLIAASDVPPALPKDL